MSLVSGEKSNFQFVSAFPDAISPIVVVVVVVVVVVNPAAAWPDAFRTSKLALILNRLGGRDRLCLQDIKMKLTVSGAWIVFGWLTNTLLRTDLASPQHQRSR